GLKFTQHYSGSTVCGPSRSTLLMGQHTGNIFLRGNGMLQVRPNPADMTFPSALQKIGYSTSMIGKSGLACNSDDGALPNTKGFDEFFGFTSHTQAHWYYPTYLWDNGKKVEYPTNTLHEGGDYSSDRVMDRAFKYIEDKKNKPFFLHLAFQIPHASLRAKEEWKAKYRPILKEELLPAKKHPHYSYEREPKTTFAAMVSYMDDNVGKVLDKLKELGIDKKTLVIFASDNGAMQEGGHKRDSFNSNGELRGGKRDLYEGGVRTPCIAYWPGTIAPGRVTDHLSAFWDISPTVRELTGAEVQTDTDGISLVPTLTGKGKQKKHKNLYWEFYEQGGKRAIRQGKWKLIYFQTNTDKTPKCELYDLSKDPSEENDISQSFPEVISELTKEMNRQHTFAEYERFRFATERPADYKFPTKKKRKKK
ncbi:MAG: arylsulfatase, partial [Lentisphaeraceae bacterium]|nr:arylsulfatase [Lentisphaeraceae bacterium]